MKVLIPSQGETPTDRISAAAVGPRGKQKAQLFRQSLLFEPSPRERNMGQVKSTEKHNFSHAEL